MATNVTEKDKTLNEIIEWCVKREIEGVQRSSELLDQGDATGYSIVVAQNLVYRETAEHCRSLLGYSGSMPDEVPNQSEDAK